MFSKSVTPAAVAFVVLATLASCSAAQQPQAPSQQFQPVRNVPPSVHVPAGPARNLRDANMNSYTSHPEAIEGSGATTFNFSDTPGATFRQPEMSGRGNSTAVGQQVSYQQIADPGQNRSLEIPAVLRNTVNDGSRRSQLQNFEQQPPSAESLRPPTAGPSNPNGFPIVVDSQGFADHRREMENQVNELRVLENANATGQPAVSATATGSAPIASMQKFSTNSSPNPTSIQQVAYLQQPETANPGAVSSAQSSGSPSETSDGNDSNSFPMTQRVSAGADPAQVNAVRQVSSESETISAAAMNLASPGIQVLAFGPGSIGINKTASFRVTVANDSGLDSEQIVVGIKLPESVELQNINMTTGHHEITDGVDQSRLVWTIDQVAAKATHTISINAIPRSADPFDMAVEWSLAPRTGTTHVQVTQPRLEMKISGPAELQFGEKALYDVTISNPGTGAAEQVSVALPEALGGERTMIGDIAAGGEKRFNVELLARTAGQLQLAATAFADGDISATANHDILVRRANLNIAIEGPPMKYAGSQGQYTVTISNTGDATASEIMAVMALPTGVQYVSGVNNAQTSDSGLKWNVGTIPAGDKQVFRLTCQLESSGNLLFQAGARGSGDLAATSECQTMVDTIADLVLRVEDPKGPLPTGEIVSYRLVVRNRGTRSASGVNMVMQFSEGIEPIKAEGFKNQIETGQVVFDPIARIEPGQEMVLTVAAKAIRNGNHVFRAQLTCEESDSREIAEGTTRFFGDDIELDGLQIAVPANVNTANASDDIKPETNDFK